MDNILEQKINLTVDNYRTAKMELRNDGDIINHFASLVFAHFDKKIQVEKIRKIRKFIITNTNRMSGFRGDILYIISILIATVEEDFQDKLINDTLEVMHYMEENGFKTSSYSVLTAYVIARYGKDNREKIISNIKIYYNLLKSKYDNITSDDDYLICALWSINSIDVETVDDFVDNIYEHVSDSNIKSKNGVQGLSNSIILNKSSGQMYNNMEFLSYLEKRDLKIANQFLPLIGVVANSNPRRCADLVERIINSLCDEEGEYEFYMDKGFRTVIAITILSFCINNDRKYVDELLAHGVITFINSKNKGIFAEVMN